MARTELHSDRLPPPAQRAPVPPNATEPVGDFITTEQIGSIDGDYLADLAMLEEPVTIRIEPSADKNAATMFPVWVNGKGVECLIRDRWREVTYLPVGVVLTVKRKYLGIIIAAKTDAVHTKVQNMDSDQPNNTVQRFTTPVMAFSILEDLNPRGAAWVAEERRRNL